MVLSFYTYLSGPGFPGSPRTAGTAAQATHLAVGGRWQGLQPQQGILQLLNLEWGAGGCKGNVRPGGPKCLPVLGAVTGAPDSHCTKFLTI